MDTRRADCLERFYKTVFAHIVVKYADLTQEILDSEISKLIASIQQNPEQDLNTLVNSTLLNIAKLTIDDFISQKGMVPQEAKTQTDSIPAMDWIGIEIYNQGSQDPNLVNIVPILRSLITKEAWLQAVQQASATFLQQGVTTSPQVGAML